MALSLSSLPFPLVCVGDWGGGTLPHPKIRGDPSSFSLTPPQPEPGGVAREDKASGNLFYLGTCCFPPGLRIRVVASSSFFLETLDMV